MVALINPRGLHHFNERYRDHIGTTDLNGLHLLLVLWLRISRLRMYGWVYICFSSWHRYMRESQSAVSGCASLNGPVCAARSSLASSVGGAQITQIKIPWLAYKRVRSDRPSVTFGLNTVPSWASHFFCESHRSYIEEAQKKR